MAQEAMGTIYLVLHAGGTPLRCCPPTRGAPISHLCGAGRCHGSQDLPGGTSSGHHGEGGLGAPRLRQPMRMKRTFRGTAPGGMRHARPCGNSPRLDKNGFVEHLNSPTMDVAQSDADATCGPHLYTVAEGSEAKQIAVTPAVHYACCGKRLRGICSLEY